MKKKFNLTNLIIVVVLFSGLFFYLGLSYQKTKMPTPGSNRDAMRASLGEGNFANSENSSRGTRGGQIIGEIIKINEESFTIKLNDGGSNTIYMTDETTINQMSKADRNSLEEGREIIVSGNAQENQTIIADSIQIR